MITFSFDHHCGKRIARFDSDISLIDGQRSPMVGIVSWPSATTSANQWDPQLTSNTAGAKDRGKALNFGIF